MRTLSLEGAMPSALSAGSQQMRCKSKNLNPSDFLIPFMSRVFSILLVIAMSCAPSIAQRIPNKTCRILFLQRPVSAPKTLFLFDGIQSREVELPRMNFSIVYELPAETRSIALLSQPLSATSRDDSTARQIPANAPKSLIPETVVDFYLLLVSDPANAVAPVKMQIVDANIEKFRRGQMLWINLTDLTVGGQLGNKQILVKPNGKTIMDAPVTEGDYPVNVSYHKEGMKRAEPIFQTRWVHDRRARSLAFVISETAAMLPRVMVFEDIRAEKQENGSAQP
jgi:hypothetical protein